MGCLGSSVAAAFAIDLRDSWALNTSRTYRPCVYTESYQEPFRLMNQIRNALRFPISISRLPEQVSAAGLTTIILTRGSTDLRKSGHMSVKR
jgi:hypothetical protein